MTEEYSFLPSSEDRIAYIRPVKVAELPEEVRAQIDHTSPIFAVHDQSGERLALVAGEQLAFVMARQNDYTPVRVH